MAGPVIGRQHLGGDAIATVIGVVMNVAELLLQVHVVKPAELDGNVDIARQPQRNSGALG